MKKLSLLLLFAFTLSSYSQSRTNPKKDLIIGEFQSWVKGDDLSGWDFDKEEWKERKGYLRVGKDVDYIDINEKYNSTNTESKSRTLQNLNEWGVIKVTYKGKEYVGFGIETVGGRYKYPSIREDWYTYINYNVYLFEKEELLKLETLDGILDLKVLIGTYGDSLNKEKKYKSCYNNLKFLLEKGDRDNEIFKFKKTESDGVNVVRFLTSQKISKYGYKPIDFENHYFEVNMEKFNELLSIIKI
jgi:hypothetical protein